MLAVAARTLGQALTNSSSVQAPMPVCGSGVILGATRSPNGVSIGAAAGEIVAAAGKRMARRAIAGDREVVAALDLVEILLVDTGRRERPARRLSAAPSRSARDSMRRYVVPHAWTSGPGFLRYCERIAAADQ